MLLLLALGCLINRDLYEQKRDELHAADTPAGDDTAGGDDTSPDDDTDTPPDTDDTDDTAPADADGDGFAPGTGADADCDDARADVYPGAAETPYDGVDQDCSGEDLVDVDADGHDGGDAGDDCDDADPSIHPGAAETWANGLRDDDCDGDPEPATTLFGATTRTGVTTAGQAGARVLGLDDLDGDGRAEWAASAFYDDTAGMFAGAVYVVSGSAGGSLGDGRAIRPGAAGWFLGSALDTLPDTDGDGAAELLVGATGVSDGAGAGYLVASSVLAAGDVQLPDDAALALVGDAPGTYSGAEVRNLGDLDGDGVPEIGVTGPYLTVDDYARAGRVFVFPSDLTGAIPLDDASWTWDGYFLDGALGNHVESAGDQDGDGYADVLVTMETGVAAWIAPGGGTGGRIDEVAIVAVYNPDARRADTVRMLGDVDGDGTRDLLVASDYLALHIDLTGNPSRLLDVDAFAFAETDGSRVTSALDLGDRDGDGLPETALGCGTADWEGTGWVGIAPTDFWFGGAPDLRALALTATSVRTYAAAGSALATVADTDDDGQDDLLVGAPRDDEAGTDAGGVVVLPLPR